MTKKELKDEIKANENLINMMRKELLENIVSNLKLVSEQMESASKFVDAIHLPIMAEDIYDMMKCIDSRKTV